jgi:hypothetical protein
MHAGKNRGIMITLEKTYCRKGRVSHAGMQRETGVDCTAPSLVG